MKKILKGLVCAVAVMSMSLTNAYGVFAATTGAYEISTDKTEVKVGDEFIVTVSVKDNPGINAITAYLDYDATKIKAISAEEVANPAVKFIDSTTVNNQINLKPSATNADYSGMGADGSKTAAELGRVKVAGYLTDGDKLAESKDNGTIMAVKFKAIAASDKAVAISFGKIKTSGYNGSDVTEANVTDGNGVVGFAGGTTGGDGSNGDNGNNGGDGTATTYVYILGNVDLDEKNIVSTADATAIIAEVLRSNNDKYITNDADYLKVADVNGDGKINTADATAIIADVLKGNDDKVLQKTEVTVNKDLRATYGNK